jgi:uroporphyrinogen decarboxylase
MRERLLRALRGETVDTRPIWLMRQAGRYLPGYRALRERHGILEIARTPELAAQAAIEPVERFDVDAGVIFADISLPFTGLGVDFSIDPGTGPVVRHPIRSTEAVESLRSFDARESVGFVGEAIRRFRQLISDRPVIGFAGAPFTLATYLVEGKSSRDFPFTREILYAHPELFAGLLGRLTDVAAQYLTLQARSGAQALQLFDTHVGILNLESFERLILPHLQRLFASLRKLDVPTIYFSTGSGHLVPSFAHVGADALGVDWREPLGKIRAMVGDGMALQGNLDPGALLGTRESLHREAQRVLREIPEGRAHVFNLGHGVLPQTDPMRVEELVTYVHGQGALSE